MKINDSTNLTALLAQTGIDYSTKTVAKLLTDESYGKTFANAAAVIGSASSWSKVNTSALKWGVKDKDSFFNALAAVMRPFYGVLDVLLNDASLGIFNIVHIPGSNGYSSVVVPLLEAFGCYNIKTQYQYREDISKAYDNILRLCDDPDVTDVIRFLREREVVHYQRFGEALRLATEKMDQKNLYFVNPSFDQ